MAAEHRCVSSIKTDAAVSTAEQCWTGLALSRRQLMKGALVLNSPTIAGEPLGHGLTADLRGFGILISEPELSRSCAITRLKLSLLDTLPSPFVVVRRLNPHASDMARTERFPVVFDCWPEEDRGFLRRPLDGAMVKFEEARINRSTRPGSWPRHHVHIGSIDDIGRGRIFAHQSAPSALHLLRSDWASAKVIDLSIAPACFLARTNELKDWFTHIARSINPNSLVIADAWVIGSR